MKARVPVIHQPFIGVGQDDYNNEVEQWQEPGIDRKCYGFNFPDSQEPLTEGHNRLVVDRIMLVPKSWIGSVTDRDRFINPDEPDNLYQVEGVPGSAKYNPFRWNPGGVVLLRRVDG
ncbi:head-to-tail stopper [Gordonia phage Fribs8]|nr:head-to-tail stopper [Gordonia phage Fribs8]